MYPKAIDANPETIEKLRKIYQKSYKQIVDEMLTATDWGVANRKRILSQIDDILVGMGDDVSKFIGSEFPDLYKEGAKDAVDQLENIGAPINVGTRFNRIHQEAIQALVDETGAAFGETITGIKRSAQALLGRATREAITQKMATGMISGKALDEVRKQIKGVLQERGLITLVDRGGREWSLDRYAEMLYRTKSVEARNRGMVNRMVENEYDLVQVSNHGSSSCPMCAPWQGRILSMTGATKGYPTMATAQSEGLFHPNCRHAVNALVPSLANLTKAYDPETKTIVVKQ
jgi:hypothetical protein